MCSYICISNKTHSKSSKVVSVSKFSFQNYDHYKMAISAEGIVKQNFFCELKLSTNIVLEFFFK